MAWLPKLRIGHVTDAHVTRLLVDALIVVVCPLVFMAESGLANGFVYAGGHLGVDFTSCVALLRGFALEGFIFAMFKWLHHLFLGGTWKGYVLVPVPLFFGFVGMLNSAGCSLIWMNQTDEFKNFSALSSKFMGPQLGGLATVSLALLFPIAVGLFAVFDVKHIIHEAINSTRYKTRSLKVRMAEEYIKQVEQEITKQVKQAAPQTAQIVQENTRQLVERFRRGDDSFGLDEMASGPVQPSVTRIAPGYQPQQLPSGQPPITGQFGPAGPSLGNTVQLQYPPQPPQGQPFPPQQPRWNDRP